ncbi:MAG: hypothetical protein ABIS43_20125 [Opitutus sp.]
MIYLTIIFIGIASFVIWMCELCGITHIGQWSHNTELGHIVFIVGFLWLSFQIVNAVIKGFRKRFARR